MALTGNEALQVLEWMDAQGLSITTWQRELVIRILTSDKPLVLARGRLV